MLKAGRKNDFNSSCQSVQADLFCLLGDTLACPESILTWIFNPYRASENFQTLEGLSKGTHCYPCCFQFKCNQWNPETAFPKLEKDIVEAPSPNIALTLGGIVIVLIPWGLPLTFHVWFMTRLHNFSNFYALWPTAHMNCPSSTTIEMSWSLESGSNVDLVLTGT